MAEISRMGATKHAHDFDRAVVFSDRYPVAGYRDAIGRHVLDMAIDGDWNGSDGAFHAGQIVWNALALLEYTLMEKENVGSTRNVSGILFGSHGVAVDEGRMGYLLHEAGKGGVYP